MMTQTIWKYSVSHVTHKLDLPQGAKILCVQIQNGYPVLWALVDPRQNVVPRTIQVTGTGFNDSDRIFGRYISTVQFADGTVWHYFDGGQ
jgi:hypothetical protein